MTDLLESRTQNVLVTGGNGFIGSRLIQFLTDAGMRVTIWDVSRPDGEREDVEWEVVDLLSAQAVSDALPSDGFDAAVHLASGGRMMRDLAACARDVTMASHILDIVNSGLISHVVMMGSADQYGNSPAPQSEDTPLRPVSAYGLAKTLVDELTTFQLNHREASVVTLRPFSVYGEGQPSHMFLPQLVRACVRGTDFRMSHGMQKRDFVYVDDVCKAILRALVVRPVQAFFNVGTGVPTVIWDLAVTVKDLTGADVEILRGEYSRSEDPPELVADTSRAETHLGWSSSVPLEEGLLEMIEHERR